MDREDAFWSMLANLDEEHGLPAKTDERAAYRRLIASRILERRAAVEMSRATLAGMCGVSVNTIGTDRQSEKPR